MLNWRGYSTFVPCAQDVAINLRHASVQSNIDCLFDLIKSAQQCYILHQKQSNNRRYLWLERALEAAFVSRAVGY